ncbi:hypothetical protein BYT27DRAFT_7325734 [Phlegmacium glaucopus]|nr:hypothetical protein BYT27DRAFT_7325734 [Phlegmacium glaucopus]
MPSVHCPRCTKKFKDQTSLLQHMNQPSSSCLTHFEEHINIFNALQSGPTTSESDDMGQESFEPPDFMDTMEDSLRTSPHSPLSPPTAASQNPEDRVNPFSIRKHPTSGSLFGHGETFMDQFDKDTFTETRKEHLYYPFASGDEWELASFLLHSRLSMAVIDHFLNLKLIKDIGLSFGTAKDLRNRAKILPNGPLWKSKLWTTTFPTKKKLFLYYRDPIDCLQSILHNPLVKDHIQFHPFQLFQSAEGVMQVYTEWLSGNTAWEMQDSLPQGATLLGTILSSNKTNISAMTGNCIAHPLLISLANLNMNFRMKSSNHAFLLLALLPVPSFIHQKKCLCGLLADRLIHKCLDFVLQPLKTAASIGTMMSDPLGWYNFWHEPRTASTTLAQLHVVEEKADPWDLEAYFKAASQFHLNGIHRPFWVNWPMSDPSVFLTPEPLHHWHKAFWDHNAKWCINTVGAAELDFRFSILHQRVGLRHFKEGISSLKQVTGREHREVQRYIVAVIADAVPPNFLVAIQTLIDFRYLAQSMEIDEQMCTKIDAALSEFHDHKESIIAVGARQGKHHVIDNWYIPKLEFLQSVIPNIHANSIALQWLADGTEHAHIDVIKDPADLSNNQNYESQISIRDAGVNFHARFSSTDEDNNDSNSISSDNSIIEMMADLVNHINPISQKSLRSHPDYFAQAANLGNGPPSQVLPTPARTFCSSQAAFHLNRDPSYKCMLIDDVATLFNIPDLCEALSNYMQCIITDDGYIRALGGRRSASQGPLPFTHLQIWKKFCLQNKAYHYPHETLRSEAVNACPPSGKWELGRHDPVIANLDPACEWPHSGLKGLDTVHLAIIEYCANPQILKSFHCIIPDMKCLFWEDRFLTYACQFDIVPQINKNISGSTTAQGPYPEPKSSLYILKQGKRANHELIGDILPLQQVRASVDLTPCFGNVANHHLTKYNSFSYCSEFWLNKYFNKELYLALS